MSRHIMPILVVFVASTMFACRKASYHVKTINAATLTSDANAASVVQRDLTLEPLLNAGSFQLQMSSGGGSLITSSITMTSNIVSSIDNFTQGVRPPPPALRVAAPLPYLKDFVLTGIPIQETIKVYVNNVEMLLGEVYLFNPPSTVSFRTHPPDSSAIRIEYQADVATLVYVFSLPKEALPASLRIVDAKTGLPADASYADGEIRLAAAAFKKGETLTITYELADPERFKALLPEVPDLSSVVAEDGQVTCKGDRLTLDGKTLNLAECGFDGTRPINVSFKYVASIPDWFELPEIANPDAYTWEISVDGVAIPFERDGNRFTLKKPVGAGAKLKVIGRKN